MDNPPPVSIYVVTYLNSEERGEVLRCTCEWLLKQRYPNFEVVVSDNCGSYSASDALASIDDPRLRVCTNRGNAGFTGNMNRCLDYCSHNIIKLACDDDLLHLDFLKHTVPFVDDETCVVVDYKTYLVGTEPKEIGEVLRAEPEAVRRAAGYSNDFWTFSYISLPGCTLFTKKLFCDLGGYDAKSPLSDFDFLMEARFKSSVLHVKSGLCYMGIWDGSLTQEMLQCNPFFFPVGQLYTMFRLLRTRPLSFKAKLHLRGRLLKHFIWQGLRLLKHCFEKKYWIGYIEYLRTFFRYSVSIAEFE